MKNNQFNLEDNLGSLMILETSWQIVKQNPLVNIDK